MANDALIRRGEDLHLRFPVFWKMRVNLSFLFCPFFAALVSSQQNLNENNPSVQRVILDSHNFYRRTADPAPKALPDLTWNSGAAVTARNVVRGLADSCTLRHSPSSERKVNNVGCGENLALFSGNQPEPWHFAINLWGKERDDAAWKFGCSRQETFGRWGHYSAMVHQRTTS